MDQLIVHVDPKEPMGEVRCIACDHRWSNISEVQARDFTICPEVFNYSHIGGFKRLKEKEPEAEVVTAPDPPLDESDKEIKPDQTLVECPNCHEVSPYPHDEECATFDGVYCYWCAGVADQSVPEGKRTLICTVGLPRSGKSTWAKATGYPVVSPDSIRLALYGRDWYYPAEAWVWAIAHTMVEALFLAGHDTVVLDATNVSQDRRQHWISRYGAENIIWKIFRTPASVCRARATRLNQPDLLPVIAKMEELWDVDDPTKGIKSYE
jgi:predicted kinase